MKKDSQDELEAPRAQFGRVCTLAVLAIGGFAILLWVGEDFAAMVASHVSGSLIIPNPR